MMDHTDARRLLSDGTTTKALQDHLADCAECRAYADALDTVLHHAPTLIADPPADLQARLLANVGSAPVISLPTRRPWIAGVAAAAAAAIVAGIVWTGGLPRQEGPAQVLAAAVGRVHGADATSFAFDVAGSAEIRLPEIRFDAEIGLDGSVGPGTRPSPPPPPPPPPPPIVVPTLDIPTFDVPSLEIPSITLPTPPPVEIPTVDIPDLQYLSELPTADAYVEGLQRLAPEIPTRDRKLLVDRLHLGLELERLGVDVHADVEVHERVGVDGLVLQFEGTGHSDGDRASQYVLSWRVLEPAEASGAVEVVTHDDRTFVRSDGSSWLVTTTAPGFHLGAATAPHDLDDILDDLASPGSTPTELGTDTIRGAKVRGLEVVDGRTRTAVWIGLDDGLIHRIEFEREATSDTTAQFVAATVFDLYDHGLTVDVQVPENAVPFGGAPLTDLPPFWLDPAGPER